MLKLIRHSSRQYGAQASCCLYTVFLFCKIPKSESLKYFENCLQKHVDDQSKTNRDKIAAIAVVKEELNKKNVDVKNTKQEVLKLKAEIDEHKSKFEVVIIGDLKKEDKDNNEVIEVLKKEDENTKAELCKHKDEINKQREELRKQIADIVKQKAETDVQKRTF